jgi:hypothetical protein
MTLPGSTSLNSYTFQITLLGVTPVVWRLVAVPGSLTLDRLHQVIQLAMGWGCSHPYRFDIAGRNYEEPPADGSREAVDPRTISLDELGLSQGSSLTYIYDSKDDWVHHLTVQGVAPFAATLSAPALLGGAGACPPEASGGPGGYAALLAALRTPDSPAGQDARERLGKVTDPEFWEPTGAAEQLPKIGAVASQRAADSHAGGKHSGGRSKKHRRGRR